MSVPFVDETDNPRDNIRKMCVFMRKGKEAAPSLVGSRAVLAWIKERGFKTIVWVKANINVWKEKLLLPLHFLLTSNFRLLDRYSGQRGCPRL
jgi:hypothetical protein